MQRLQDLWAEINAGAEFDLAGGMASFIDQPGVPLVTVTELGGGRYQFSQSRIVTGGAEIEQSWIIPLSYRYASGESVRTASLVIDEASEVVDLDADVDWILPNADERGYIRWSIPEDMLLEMGKRRIHPPECSRAHGLPEQPLGAPWCRPAGWRRVPRGNAEPGE